jgi:hypothetical protein
MYLQSISFTESSLFCFALLYVMTILNTDSDIEISAKVVVRKNMHTVMVTQLLYAITTRVYSIYNFTSVLTCASYYRI